MDELSAALERILEDLPLKIVISNPSAKTYKFRKVVATKKDEYYQIKIFTETQAFHENIMFDHLAENAGMLSVKGFVK